MSIVRVREFLDYIEKNGYPQSTGYLVETDGIGTGGTEEDYSKVKRTFNGAACAMGQGILNLWKDKYPKSRFSTIANHFYGSVIADNQLLDNEHCTVNGLYERCNSYQGTFEGMVVHLNDDHNFGIQRIVDHLRATLTERDMNLEVGRL